jgi:alcohol dehydrogenase (NADP+)
LRVNGHFLNVNVPSWKYPEIGMELMMSQVYISGSASGSIKDMQEMMDFAAAKNIKPWIQKYPMKDVNKAIQDFKDGKPRFRFVLENKE